MAWILYGAVVLITSGVIGLHLGKFRDAFTDMTGMMAGMTVGILNRFVLGYVAGAAASSMFWGNLIGVLLGLALGAYFGRAGALMGVMDGAMGGVMGGSMGAMLAVMVIFPTYGLFWTALLLGLIYIAGMVGLVVLIEQSAPEHAALHRLLPVFTRAVAVEAAEEAARSRSSAARPLPIEDYYALLALDTDASSGEINDAYLAKLAVAAASDLPQLERAIAILSDPTRRRAYDARLRACCPPKKARSTVTQPALATVAAASAIQRTGTAYEAKVPVKAGAASNGSKSTQARPARGSSAVRTRQGPHASKANNKSRRRASQSPISGVGVFMGVLLVAALLAWWAMLGGRTSS